jgi:DNA processing protein
MDQERLSLHALHLVPGIGDRLFKQLISYCGSASQVFAKPKGKLMKIPGIGPVVANAIHQKNSFEQAEKEIQKAAKDQVQITFYLDATYPVRLKPIDDAPALLYIKGNVNLNVNKVVAIVGTRKATSYGKEFVEKISDELLPHKPLIVSGLAYGIDIHAHKHALKTGLNTVAVLGSGIDVIYPAAHKDTAKKMLSGGGLISENPMGTKPDAHNFPARNRIIAGLCDALIVVEAAETGGALITAEIANAYNKDVFALPGNLGNEYSSGCNKLIKTNKASLISSVKDLEYIMNWSADDSHDTSTESSPIYVDLSAEEQLIVEALNNKPLAIDELTIKTSLSPSVLANHLLVLELKNILKVLPGKIFKLN